TGASCSGPARGAASGGAVGPAGSPGPSRGRLLYGNRGRGRPAGLAGRCAAARPAVAQVRRPDRYTGNHAATPYREHSAGPRRTRLAPAAGAVLGPAARRPPDRLAAAAVADLVGAVDRRRRGTAGLDPVRVQRRRVADAFGRLRDQRLRRPL